MTAKEMEACRIVEDLCRSLGRDVEVMFLSAKPGIVQCVSIAAMASSGDSTGKTLVSALEDALKEAK